ncbi:CLOCK-interacting pacemaker [Aplochiton taeniatus]
MSPMRKTESHSRAMSKLLTVKSGSSIKDAERDSGISDVGSEYTSTTDPTDSDDSSLSAVGARSQHSQLAVVGGSYSNLSSMIIMNNVVLKQPDDSAPTLKPWSFSPSVEVVQPIVQQSQVVFLQPVVSCQTSSSSKEGFSKRKRSKKYLPILKSYPKIAPHPGDGSSSSGRGSFSSSYSTSSSSGSERGHSLTSSHKEHNHKDKQQQQLQKRHLSGSSISCSSTTPGLPAPSSSHSPLPQHRLRLSLTDSSACSSPTIDRPSPAVSRSEFNSSPSPCPSVTPSDSSENSKQALSLTSFISAAKENSCPSSAGEDDGPESLNKRKRFCNTYNILSNSGLLDITLRTKELLRQNRRTQGELDRLREHTDLFLQALKNGDTSIWAKLQISLQEEDREREKEKGRVVQGLKAD